MIFYPRCADFCKLIKLYRAQILLKTIRNFILRTWPNLGEKFTMKLWTTTPWLSTFNWCQILNNNFLANLKLDFVDDTSDDLEVKIRVCSIMIIRCNFTFQVRFLEISFSKIYSQIKLFRNSTELKFNLTSYSDSSQIPEVNSTLHWSINSDQITSGRLYSF